MANSNKNNFTFYPNGDGTCTIGLEAPKHRLLEVVIPEVSPDGMPVVGIAKNGFNDCARLTSITIPESVTEIGEDAFYNCASLTSITIPNSVTKIGKFAFAWCERLTSITIPKSVTKIGCGVFTDCHDLSSITVEEGNPVYHNSGNCLIKTNSKLLVSGCRNSVIPNDGSVTAINAAAFDGCVDLTKIDIPDCVVRIGCKAFGFCSALESIDLPESLTKLYSYTFIACENLASVRLPKNLTFIGDGAFGYCESLTSITIPGSVKSIGKWVFGDCDSLTSVTYLGTKEEWNAIKKGNVFGDTENILIHCTDGDVVEHGTNAGVNEYVWNTSAGL